MQRTKDSDANADLAPVPAIALTIASGNSELSTGADN